VGQYVIGMTVRLAEEGSKENQYAYDEEGLQVWVSGAYAPILQAQEPRRMDC